MTDRTPAAVAARVSTDPAFLERVATLVEEYRYWHRWDFERPGRKDTGAELRRVRRMAGELAAWLEAALGSEQTPERHALERLALARHGRSVAYLDDATRAHALLLELAADSLTPAEELLPERRYPRSAPRIAADGLATLFASVGQRASATAGERGTSPAVDLLVAIAHAAGDRSMTEVSARDWLLQARHAE